MASIAQIEASIQTLPMKEFFSLLGWMTERHLEILSSGDFEDPEIETEPLKSFDSPRRTMDEGLFHDIRAMAVEATSSCHPQGSATKPNQPCL